MTRNVLFLCLCSFYWLALVGCAPTSEPLAATRLPVAQTTATLPAASETATQSATSTFAPTATEAWQTRAAHLTSLPLPPSETPTVTDTPTPTFTPYPGPVWRILFLAVPCPEILSSCNNDLYMSYTSRWYLINSDGSDLTPLEDTGSFLADLWGFSRLSPDGKRLAYLMRSDEDQKLHLMLAEIHSGKIADLGLSPEVVVELGFSPEPECLMVYTTPRPEQVQEFQAITVIKICADSSDWEVLATVKFSTLPASQTHLSSITLSPQGDALLIRSRNVNDISELYIYEFGNSEQPNLLFAAEDESWGIGLPSWQPNGQHIEFFLQRWETNNTVSVHHYMSVRDGTDAQIVAEMSLPFSLDGAWSPDREEIAFFPGLDTYAPATSGLYILDLTTGKWRQIASNLYSDTPHVHTWQVDLP